MRVQCLQDFHQGGSFGLVMDALWLLLQSE